MAAVFTPVAENVMGAADDVSAQHLQAVAQGGGGGFAFAGEGEPRLVLRERGFQPAQRPAHAFLLGAVSGFAHGATIGEGARV